MWGEVYGGIYLKMMPDACTHFCTTVLCLFLIKADNVRNSFLPTRLKQPGGKCRKPCVLARWTEPHSYPSDTTVSSVSSHFRNTQIIKRLLLRPDLHSTSEGIEKNRHHREWIYFQCLTNPKCCSTYRWPLPADSWPDSPYPAPKNKDCRNGSDSTPVRQATALLIPKE